MLARGIDPSFGNLLISRISKVPDPFDTAIARHRPKRLHRNRTALHHRKRYKVSNDRHSLSVQQSWQSALPRNIRLMDFFIHTCLPDVPQAVLRLKRQRKETLRDVQLFDEPIRPFAPALNVEAAAEAGLCISTARERIRFIPHLSG